jgi:hypothetical protein
MNTEVLSNEIPEVEETSEVNEESASVPASNDFEFVLCIFRFSTMTCALWNFMLHYSNCISEFPQGYGFVTFIS